MGKVVVRKGKTVLFGKNAGTTSAVSKAPISTISAKRPITRHGAAIRPSSKNVADELVASMREAVAIVQGKASPARVHAPPQDVDVRAIRERLGLSQSAFAAKFGFGIGAVREWEQGRRRPEQAARTLLLVIDRNPDAVTEALTSAA